MKRLILLLIVLLLIILLTPQARAATVDISEYRTKPRTPLGLPAGLETSGLALKLQVTESADRFRFTVTNDTVIDSALNFLFFEQGLAPLMKFDTFELEESGGVDFRRSTVLKQAPRRPSIGWDGSAGSYRAVGTTYNRKVANAVNAGAGEMLTVSFRKRRGATLDDVLAISDTTGRVVVHLRDVSGIDISSDLVAASAPIPQPAGALLLAAAAYAMFGGRVRRP